jgi:hypothetical protein
MLTSITPLGERGRGRRWGATVAAYLIGSAAGGAVLGWLLGLAGVALAAAVPAATRWALATAAVATSIVLDLWLGGARLPGVSRQVNEDWLERYRGWVLGLGFGFQLGLGLVTIVTTSTVYLTFALALLAGSWPAGLAIGLTFGLVRALPLLTVARVTSPALLAGAHERLDAMAPVVRRLTVALLVLMVAVMAAFAVGAAA